MFSSRPATDRIGNMETWPATSVVKFMFWTQLKPGQAAKGNGCWLTKGPLTWR
jgi:hypothetical protein